MNINQLLGKRSAESPKDAKSPGHRLLLRGGYVRQSGRGIFSLLPLAQRVRAKIEAIIRQELDALGGQEIQMPVVAPAELWQESGRYESVGPELVRFEDRTGHPHVLNMTNEETVVDLVRANVDSYRQLPLLVYQLQTKFRDEARSRAGLIRVREFTMKDAYSFHRTQEDLEAWYERCRQAYVRIFARCGLTKVVDIESSVGMMGGHVAHEFMLLNPHGEDSLFLCDACGYRANREVTPASVAATTSNAEAPLADVVTPGQKTIEEVAAFLGVVAGDCCKAVLFMTDDGRPLAAFVRGDREVDATKLRLLAGASELRPLREDELASLGITPGFVGPLGLDRGKITVYLDRSVREAANLVIGGNQSDLHRRGFNARRDLPEQASSDICQAEAGDPCPRCAAPLRGERGIEVGNIFQLGTKYTQAMGFTYSEEDGTARHPIMGCYGIGVGRTLACIVEEHHDERGPRWPAAVAPFHVQICALQVAKPGVREASEELYARLRRLAVDVLIDTREVGAGFMFADADLIGAPLRAIVSPRNVQQSVVELKYLLSNPREGLPTSLPIQGAGEQIAELVQNLTRS
jgi:prolyl-tRNA synthetase